MAFQAYTDALILATSFAIIAIIYMEIKTKWFSTH